MKTKEKFPLPVDIKLPERVMFDDGTMFVTLRTLDELEQFWQEHKSKFEFACKELAFCDPDNPIFLREYEWVFGVSKSTVVRKVMRWDDTGVGCEFYDWAKDDPEDWHFWFKDREKFRESQIAEGLWSDEDEVDYNLRTPNTYRGWWRLKNIPGGVDASDFLGFDAEEIFDFNMPITEVEKILQEQVFDTWKDEESVVNAYDRKGIEDFIAYWHQERSDGRDYYGAENETA